MEKHFTLLSQAMLVSPRCHVATSHSCYLTTGFCLARKKDSNTSIARHASMN
ncbi:hypothetical protein ACHAWF_011758 [Thalassiosira exigua]